jgi:hypothetical protein
MGTFAGASEQYGAPISFVHPADNDMAKARFNPLLLDPRFDLTDKQRREIQQEIDEFTALLKLGQEKAGTQTQRQRQQQRQRQRRRAKSKTRRR